MKKIKKLVCITVALVTILVFSGVAFATDVGTGPYNVQCYNVYRPSVGNMDCGIDTHDQVTNYISNTTYNGYPACGYNSSDQNDTFKAVAYRTDTYYCDRVRVHSYPYNNELRIDPNTSSNWVGTGYNTTGRYVECVQRTLSYMGYSLGTIDGIWGTKTKTAIKAFQVENNLYSDGIVGTDSWDSLISGYPYGW